MLSLFLKALGLMGWFFGLIGVDVHGVKGIIGVKYLMYLRSQEPNEPDSKGRNGAVVKVIFGYFLFGLMFSFLVAKSGSLHFSMISIFSGIMLLIGIPLFTSLSQLLLDTSDLEMLIPKPIAGRTILVARMIIIGGFITILAGPLALPSMIVGTVRFGLLFLAAFVMALVLCVVFTLFGVYGIYLLLLKNVKASVFNFIYPYLQVVIPVMLFMLFKHLVLKIDFSSIQMEVEGWAYFFPPFWMGGLVDGLLNGWGRGYGGIQALGIGGPLLLMAWVLFYLAPRVEKKLMQFHESRYRATNKGWLSHFDLAGALSRLWAVSRVEQASFKMVWSIISRDNKYKVQTYWGIGIILIWGFYNLESYSSWADCFENLASTKRHLGLIYLNIFILLPGIYQMYFSEHARASWIYQVQPFKQKGKIISGGYKAVMTRLGLSSCISGCFILMIWGISSIADVVFGVLVMMLFCLHIAVIFSEHMPFSLDYSQMKNVSGVLLKSALAMALFAGLAGSHLFLSEHLWLVSLSIPVLIAVLVLSLGHLSKVSD